MPKRKSKSKPNPEVLERIAEEAINHGWDNIRSTLINAVAGRSFYQRFCLGRKNMEAILEQIRQLNPDRYGHLRYIPFQRKRGLIQRLRPEEEEK